MLAADYPFFDVMWTIFAFFIMVLWFWLLFTVFVDVFRRHDLSGWGKAAWLIFVILLPYLGVFVYLIANSDSMTFRAMDRRTSRHGHLDHVAPSSPPSGAAETEIGKAQELLDSGAINQAEFDQIKQRALGSPV
jgi:Phospholipase_D-nuclease N-terminal/Short C-terminal domain